MAIRMMTSVFIIIAVLFGLLVNLLPDRYLNDLVSISHFFSAMLPILGAGALLKYLCSGIERNQDE